MNRHFEKKDLLLDDRRIAVIGDFLEPEDTDTAVYDAEGCYVTPGFIDVHTHGGFGVDVNAATQEDYEKIGHFFAKEGTTSWHCSILTDTEEQTDWCIKEAVKHHEANTAAGQPHGNCADLMGIHLEGPFISMEKKGAQNPAYIRNPDVEMFLRLQEAAHGLVRLITIAPETDGAKEFIRRLADQVHISVGHTCSDYETAYRAFSLGADHVTHFFNAMPPFTHRAPGVFGAAFDAKHVMPELICDGIHIDASAVRVVFSLFGAERMILISDSMMATGMEDGAYSLGGLPVTVRGNLATLEDGTIAGSATNLMDCMRKAVSMGIPLETAVRAATYNPARAIGAADVCGSITAGHRGDCVLLSKDDLSTKKVIFGGKVVA